MGKRGPKPKGTIKLKWSPKFAYAIGLITSDGSLSKDGRHVTLTSVDLEQMQNFSLALSAPQKISTYKNSTNGSAYRIQIGDVSFYNFLNTIGLTPAKSLILGKIKVPDKYFFHFLRGSFDGDGCTYSYFDKRWKSSFMFYVSFCSASKKHVVWVRNQIKNMLCLKGHITYNKKQNGCYRLCYAKTEAIALLKQIYKNKTEFYLTRKYLKINDSLSIVGLVI